MCSNILAYLAPPGSLWLCLDQLETTKTLRLRTDHVQDDLSKILSSDRDEYTTEDISLAKIVYFYSVQKFT